jgi:hypothetical protein
MDALTWASLAALVIAFVNLVKFVRGKDWNSAITQVVVWVVAVLLVVLVAHSDFGNTLSWGNRTLDSMNVASQVLVGLFFGSSATVINEFKKAIDNSDTAVKPPLTGGH